MKNAYLDFYAEHGISPVHQDISSMEIFIQKRRNLYRQLGIPWQSLKGRSILEFGPGGGYNALALLLGGARMLILWSQMKQADMKSRSCLRIGELKKIGTRFIRQ